MVFRKSGHIKSNEKWYYGNELLVNTDHFNYLGVIVSYTGSFSKHINNLSKKGLKSLYALSSKLNCYIRNLDVSILLNLFDSHVASVLNYGCEIWGFHNAPTIERVHRKFLKKILNVNINANNEVVYGETGRFPFFIHRQIQILKYWFKLNSTSNVILKYNYEMLKSISYDKQNWVSLLRNMLFKYGFGYVWYNPLSINKESFLPIFIQRIHDVYITEWREAMEKSTRLYLYREIKCNFGLEFYLTNIKNKKYRDTLCKFRCISHDLAIETGRRGSNRVERQNRICIYCEKRDIEDEYHFLFICPLYKELRIKYIDKKLWKSPSMYNLVKLLKIEEPNTLKDLARFISEALSIRKLTTYTVNV